MYCRFWEDVSNIVNAIIDWNCVCIAGSGKTSLLDCIASRADGTVSGKVYYNNSECTSEIAQQYMSYVMQV